MGKWLELLKKQTTGNEELGFMVEKPLTLLSAFMFPHGPYKGYTFREVWEHNRAYIKKAARDHNMPLVMPSIYSDEQIDRNLSVPSPAHLWLAPTIQQSLSTCAPASGYRAPVPAGDPWEWIII